MAIRRTAFLTTELPDDDVEREIASVGCLRFDGKAGDYQFHLMLRETVTGTQSRLWMPLKRLSFFPVGSVWKRQRPVSRGLQESSTFKPNLLGPARVARASKLLREGDPAGALALSVADQDFHLLELEDESGRPLLVPMSELAGQHYFLIRGCSLTLLADSSGLASPQVEAGKAGTPDTPDGSTPKPELPKYGSQSTLEQREAFRLARLLFSPMASHSLRVLGDFLHRLRKV